MWYTHHAHCFHFTHKYVCLNNEKFTQLIKCDHRLSWLYQTITMITANNRLPDYDIAINSHQ